MELAIITGPTYDIAKKRILQANTLKDGIELRLDLFYTIDLEHIKKLRALSTGKVLFTLRSKQHGGGFLGSEKDRLALLHDLLSLNPDYLDIDYTSTPPTTTVPLIFSYHNYLSTPKHLEHILETMLHEQAYAYKLCTTATSLSDAYRMLRFIQVQSLKHRIIGLCMGDYGRITRTEGIKSGNYLNYGILHRQDKVAPGLTLA